MVVTVASLSFGGRLSQPLSKRCRRGRSWGCAQRRHSNHCALLIVMNQQMIAVRGTWHQPFLFLFKHE